MAETTGLLNRRTGHSVPRVRISSSPQPFWDPAAGCASSWLFSLTGPGGSFLTSGAGRRKQPRGPKDRRLHDPKGVARTPAGGKRCRKRSAAESRPSSHRPLAKQPHIGTPYGHTKRPTSCAKGRYRAMAHRNHQHCAHTALSCAAVWRKGPGMEFPAWRQTEICLSSRR